MGAHFEIAEIPDDMKDQAEKWRNHLLEEIASHDENLLEKYLAEQPLSDAEIKKLLEMGVLKMFSYLHCVVLLLKIKEFSVYLMQLTIFAHHQ